MKKSAMPDPKGLFRGASRKKNPPVETRTCEACDGKGVIGDNGPNCKPCEGGGVIVIKK